MVINGEPLYEGDTDEPCPWLEGVDLFSVIRIEKGKEITAMLYCFWDFGFSGFRM